jgi:probable selenium-dependent hydroxylase accessory protein YqeC
VVPIPLNHLASSLRLQQRELVALVGGGGKTTTLAALGRQLPGRVVLTTTTKMGRDQLGRFTVLDGPDDADLRDALGSGPVVVRSRVEEHKAIGVTAEACDRWFADPTMLDHLVVEADGARTRPFKAPRALEPVIPGNTTTVLAHIGADALGRVIVDQCHRPLRVASVAGCRPSERLTPERAAAVLLSDHGSRKGVPAAARFVVVVTKVEPANQVLVDELAAAVAPRAEVVAVEYDPGR